jgi:site-specific recombinase XerC
MTTPLVRRTLPSAAVAAVPALYAPTPEAAKRFIEYFAAHIRNPNTRRAYLHAVREFADWCTQQRFDELVDIEPLHVAAYIEQLTARLAKPSVKQHLAAIRMLFDWLVVGHVVATAVNDMRCLAITILRRIWMRISKLQALPTITRDICFAAREARRGF